MGGWRDIEGRTIAERRKRARQADQAAFADTVRRRPLRLLRGLAGLALMLLLCVAVVLWLR